MSSRTTEPVVIETPDGYTVYMTECDGCGRVAICTLTEVVIHGEVDDRLYHCIPCTS